MTGSISEFLNNKMRIFSASTNVGITSEEVLILHGSFIMTDYLDKTVYIVVSST